MSDGTDQLVDFFTFLCKLLLAGFPLYSEPTFDTMRAIMCEAKECKCYWLPVTSTFATILRMSSEFNQSALTLFQRQPKVTHPLPKMPTESLRFLLVPKIANKIGCVYNDSAVSPHCWQNSLLEPPHQHILHVYVCNDRGTDRTLPTAQFRSSQAQSFINPALCIRRTSLMMFWPFIRDSMNLTAHSWSILSKNPFISAAKMLASYRTGFSPAKQYNLFWAH